MSTIPTDDNPQQSAHPLTFPDVTGLSIPDTGIKLAQCGFHVGITAAGDIKNPGSILGTGGVYLATTNTDTLTRWFAEYSAAGLFVHAGPSGLIVFDVDKPDNVPAWLRPLLELAVFRPTSAAPGDRRGHYVFRLKRGQRFGNGLGRLRCRGEGWGEVRCYGGAIIVGPTLHPRADGKYTCGPSDPIPLLPDEIADALNTLPDTAQRPSPVDVAAFLANFDHNLALEPYALDPIVRNFDPTPGGRHDSMYDTLCWAMREAKAGRFPAQRAADGLRYLWDEAVAGEHRPDEFDRMLAAAIHVADSYTIDELWKRCHRNSRRWGGR